MAPRRRWGAVALPSVFVLLGLVGAARAGAQVIPGELADPTPSDPRATFVPGNATDCDDVGFPDSTQMGAGDDSSAADAYVSGTVATNAGAVHPGEGDELNVELLAAGVVVDAVVVKGGPAHNVYEDPAVLPPTVGPPQHYISPFNGGGNIPGISHWFVCYHLTEPEPVGSLTVVKEVIAPDGRPVEPLPTEFTAVVTCDDGENEDVEVEFARGGGRAAVGPTLTDLAPGTTCVVIEDDPGFPAGTTVSFDPPDANTTGVVIGADAAVVITITNDFSGVEELPGSVPDGWAVTYAVDGGPPSPTPPVFEVDDAVPITVAITNDPSAAAGPSDTTTSVPAPCDPADPTHPTDPTPADPGAPGTPADPTDPCGAVGGSAGGRLPDTGGRGAGLAVLGLAGAAAGLVASRWARRLRARLA